MKNQSVIGRNVAAANTGLALWGLTCFVETFVQGSTFVLRMNISAKNPPQRQARNRWLQPYMKTYILIIIILFTTLNKNYSQVFFRKKKESVEVFVNRIINKEQGDLKFHIIETAEWSDSKKVIIYFIGDESLIVGYLLTPINDSIYKQTFVDYFGGKAAAFGVEILNVFFANTDIDNQNEIIITSKLRSKSPRFSHNSVQGYYYDNNIYDNPNLTNPLDSLEINKRLTERFSQGFEGSIYNRKNGKLLRKEKAKNKEEKFIRQMLKKMGYKQGQQPT